MGLWTKEAMIGTNGNIPAPRGVAGTHEIRGHERKELESTDGIIGQSIATEQSEI